jgi:hypothetical protein
VPQELHDDLRPALADQAGAEAVPERMQSVLRQARIAGDAPEYAALGVRSHVAAIHAAEHADFMRSTERRAILLSLFCGARTLRVLHSDPTRGAEFGHREEGRTFGQESLLVRLPVMPTSASCPAARCCSVRGAHIFLRSTDSL